MNSIKQLQTELAKDLIKFEDSELSEQHLEMIEEAYQEVYLTLIKAGNDQ
jgi:hypothetical protein